MTSCLLDDKVLLVSGGTQAMGGIVALVVPLPSDRRGVVTESVIDRDQDVLGGSD